MKKKIELIKVSDGYRIEEERVAVDVDKAYEMMTSKWQFRYTDGVRDDDQVTLTKHEIVCPHCNYHLPSYLRFVNPRFFRWYVKKKKVEEDVIAEWTTRQMSLFEQRKRLRFNGVSKPEQYVCPKCGFRSEACSEMEQLRLEYEKEQLRISYETNDFAKLFSMPPLKKKEEITITFPMYETIVFNFRKGHTYICIENDEGEPIAIRDITRSPEEIRRTGVGQVFMQHPWGVEKVAEAFTYYWKGEKLPYTKEELMCCERFVLMTRFRNMPRAFYDGIPYEKGKQVIDDSFKKQEKRIRTADDIYGIFEESKLPKMKSLRKVVYAKPALVYYMSQIEMIWRAICDENLFCRLLKMDVIFDLVSFLKKYPNAIVFFEDFAKERGMKSLLFRIENRLREILDYSIGYACMDEDERRKEQETKWKKDQLERRLLPSYSRPIMFDKDVEIKNCVIYGFSFIVCRTMNDRIALGEALNNCLKDEGRPFRGSLIIAVKYSNEYKAAIEVNGGVIVQAYERDNSMLSSDTTLYQAYEKWKKKFHLKTNDFSDGILENDYEWADLPF